MATDVDQVTLTRLTPVESFAKYFYSAIAILIILFAFSVATKDVSSNFVGNLLVGLSVSMVVVAASSTVGCLLGFLFGIPRSLQRLGSNSPMIKKPGEEGAT